MATKINGSFVPRGGIARDWAQAVNFVPAANELIVYSPDTGDAYVGTGTAQGKTFTYESAEYVRFKFGDGVTNVNLLPFATTDPTAGSVEIYDGTYTFDDYSKYVNINDENYTGDKAASVRFVQEAIDDTLSEVNNILAGLINGTI